MQNTTRTILKWMGALTVRLLAAIVAGVLLLSLVFLIPAESMEPNVVKSAKTMAEEGPYPIMYDWCSSMLDNWTDSAMLLIAAYQEDGESPVQQAMHSKFYYTEKHPYYSLVNLYVHHTGEPMQGSYERYWHGYLLWLKPMLCVMSYGGIRIVNGMVHAALLLAVCWLMVKKGMKGYILPYLVAVGLLMPAVLAKSMQYSSCYDIMLMASIAVLLMKDRLREKEGVLFLYIGICVAFFDFLTYPIATIGIPAALCFVIDSGPSLKHDICRLFKICFCWCFGYGGMWSGKWIVGSWITGENVIEDAASAIAIRSASENLVAGGAAESYPILDTMYINWNEFWMTPVARVFWAVVLICALIYGLRILRNRGCIRAVKDVQMLAVIAMMPFVWYRVTINHCQVHTFFTNKSMVVFAFSVLCGCVKLLEVTGRKPEGMQR